MRIIAYMRMYFYLCLQLLGGTFFINPCLHGKLFDVDLSTTEKLITISENDQLVLERFFQVLIKSDGLGYTLFGSKPVCLSSYFSSVPLGNMLRGCNSNAIKSGWQVWKKHESNFRHPKYLIFEEMEFVDDTEIHLLYFINKEKLLEMLNKYHRLFEQELKREFDPERFLCEIEQKKTLSSLLNGHEGLLGVLLGYGMESSMNYHRRNLAWKFGAPISYSDENFQSVSTSGREDYLIDTDIRPMQFVGNPKSQEVKMILEQNMRERSYLIDIYSHGKTLEITLSKLVE
jgi:hypothetical protein